MVKKTKESIQKRKEYVLWMLQKYPDHPTKTLARKLHEDDKNLFPTLESARSAVRYATGTKGRDQEQYATHPRPKKAAGQKLELPESAAPDYKPFIIKGTNRILVLADLHIPYHDKNALKVAIEEGKKRKCNVILLLGDLLDLYQCSRWSRDPKNPNIAREIEICHQFLSYLRQEFPSAKILWKEGNHEERWKDYFFKNAPQLAVLPGTTLYDHVKCDFFKIEVIQDRRPIDASGMLLYHGQEFGKSGGGVNQARSQWNKTYKSTIAAHGHKSSTNYETDVKGNVFDSYSIGCLCHLNPNYAPINKWNHGFGLLETTPKSYTFENYIILNGQIWGHNT